MLIFIFVVSIEVQRWHGGHYMVSGGNDGLHCLSVLSVYLFFSRCFGSMSENVKDDVHYVFEDRNTLAAVKYIIIQFELIKLNYFITYL
jgi:hypothetical protein